MIIIYSEKIHTILFCSTIINKDMTVELAYNKDLSHQILLTSEKGESVKVHKHIEKTYCEVNFPWQCSR